VFPPVTPSKIRDKAIIHKGKDRPKIEVSGKDRAIKNTIHASNVPV